MRPIRPLVSGRDVVVVDIATSVVQAARIMSEKQIGAVPVVDGERVAGIFTERDVLRRVVAQGLDPATTPVAEVMTTPVITCSPDISLDDCAGLMTSRGVRHVPVHDGKGLVGVVTIRDVLAYKVNEQQATLEQMTHYIYDVR